MQFQPVCPVHFIRPQQLHPRFCIFRPGGLPTPLIALDELPSWLQISNPSPDMYIGLQPVSPSYIPREGEYEVTCINCSSSVSSVNQSMSDRNEDEQSPQSSVGATKSCTGTSCNDTTENAATVTIPKFPIGFTIGNPSFDATRQSPVLGLYSTNVSPRDPQNIPLPASTASQPSSIGESISGSENLPSEPSKSDRPDTPTTSTDSSNGTSIASTRSLTAAVERLRQRLNLKGSSRQASFRHKVHRAVRADSDSHKNSKYHRFHSEPQRRVKIPHRHRAKFKELKSEFTRPVDEMKEEDLRPEQSNSATKRRARRERLTHRLLHKNDVDRKSRYWHMTKISK
ncbi:hypothetical protein N7486_000403 [Penicillium sp. IBT 16267x]|nr:hypothetical protein N7486_000403 [Penicillium sp. IBT 16267x]